MISDNNAFLDWQQAFEKQRDSIEQAIVAQCHVFPSVEMTFDDAEIYVSMMRQHEGVTNDLMRYIDCALVFRFVGMENQTHAVFQVTADLIASSYDHAFGFSDYINPLPYEIVSYFEKTVSMDVETFGQFLVAFHQDAKGAFDRVFAQAQKRYDAIDKRRLAQKMKELDCLGLSIEPYLTTNEDRKFVDLSQWGEGAIARVLDAHQF